MSDTLYRVGVVTGLTNPARNQFAPDTLVDALRELGADNGWELQVEHRPGDAHRMDSDILELVDLEVDVIIALTTTAAQHVKALTTTIPTVFWGGDAVSSGLIQSNERPGGNLTGVTAGGGMHEFDSLLAIMPGLKRVGFLWNHTYSLATGVFENARAQAIDKGLELQAHEVFDAPGLDAAFETLVRDGAQATFVSNHPLFATEGRRIGELGLAHRLPIVSVYPPIAEHGGLIARPPDFSVIHRLMADLVRQILQGADPADLPVRVTDDLLLVINLRTAETLGLEVPPALAARADRVLR